MIKLAGILAALFFSGCAVVQPWERQFLSDPIMIINANPQEEESGARHLEIREGSSGGTGGQGGGCGCG